MALQRHQSPHAPSNSDLTALRRRQAKQQLRRQKTVRNTLKKYGLYASAMTLGIAIGGIGLGYVTAEGDSTPGTAATPGTPAYHDPTPVWFTPTPDDGLYVVTLPETGTGSSR